MPDLTTILLGACCLLGAALLVLIHRLRAQAREIRSLRWVLGQPGMTIVVARRVRREEIERN